MIVIIVLTDFVTDKGLSVRTRITMVLTETIKTIFAL